MESFRTELRSLIQMVCRELRGVEIPSRPLWTVVSQGDAPPHVPKDTDRPAFADLRFNLTIGLLRFPEYGAVADAVEEQPELKEGIIVNECGGLLKPEKDNITRAFVTNFLCRRLFLQPGVLR
jgi:hypothetical protein